MVPGRLLLRGLATVVAVEQHRLRMIEGDADLGSPTIAASTGAACGAEGSPLIGADPQRTAIGRRGVGRSHGQKVVPGLQHHQRVVVGGEDVERLMRTG